MLDIDANLIPIKTNASGSKAKRPVFPAFVGAHDMNPQPPHIIEQSHHAHAYHINKKI